MHVTCLAGCWGSFWFLLKQWNSWEERTRNPNGDPTKTIPPWLKIFARLWSRGLLCCWPQHNFSRIELPSHSIVSPWFHGVRLKKRGLSWEKFQQLARGKLPIVPQEIAWWVQFPNPSYFQPDQCWPPTLNLEPQNIFSTPHHHQDTHVKPISEAKRLMKNNQFQRALTTLA